VEETLRVLIVHNWHRSELISGENRSVEADVALLRGAGVEVETFGRSNDEIAGFGPAQWLGLTLRPTISPGDARGLRRAIDGFRPDVVHLHNLLPLISPWVVRTARAVGVPVVQTVHNYHHVCVASTYFRDGRPCHDCQGHTVPWPGVRHGCYHGSHAQSAALGLSLMAHRSTWHLVDRFLAVGGSVARHLEKAGIDPKRIVIRDIPVADPGPPVPTTTGGALYVGRLSHEKGVNLLLDAWRRSGLGARHLLRVVGDGPDRARVERAASGSVGIELLGALDHERTLELMVESSFVVVPSLWEEPGCTVAREAMARGRPVLATNRGVLADIVDADVGWVVEPTVEGMTEGLLAAFEAPLETLGPAARRRFEARFSPPASLGALLRIYAEVVRSSR
jgi:glycosyltransferase involved in cell wall biosynthesis